MGGFRSFPTSARPPRWFLSACFWVAFSRREVVVKPKCFPSPFGQMQWTQPRAGGGPSPLRFHRRPLPSCGGLWGPPGTHLGPSGSAGSGWVGSQLSARSTPAAHLPGSALDYVAFCFPHYFLSLALLRSPTAGTVVFAHCGAGLQGARCGRETVVAALTELPCHWRNDTQRLLALPWLPSPPESQAHYRAPESCTAPLPTSAPAAPAPAHGPPR